MSTSIVFPIKSLFEKDEFGKPLDVAQVEFKYFRGEISGELISYAIYDANFDDWVFVDLEKLGPSRIDELQERIIKYILQNPELNEQEPEEAS